jgi:hypothetical protein
LIIGTAPSCSCFMPSFKRKLLSYEQLPLVSCPYVTLATHDGAAFSTLSNQIRVTILTLIVKGSNEGNRVRVIRPVTFGTGLLFSPHIDSILIVIMMASATFDDGRMLFMSKPDQWSLVRTDFLMIEDNGILLRKTERDG